MVTLLRFPLFFSFMHPLCQSIKDCQNNSCIAIFPCNSSSQMRRDRTEYYRKLRENDPDYFAAACRRYRLSHPGEHYLRVKAYIAANPEKRKAHVKIKYAIRAGKIRRSPCVECSEPKSHAHHTDYSKPLQVIWLCAICHKRKHQLERV